VAGEADFSEQEWASVRKAPWAAGMFVAKAEGGGLMREVVAIAKFWGKTRKRKDKGELLAAVTSEKPEPETEADYSDAAYRQRTLEEIGEAVKAVESKASSDEVEEYKTPRRYGARPQRHVRPALRGILGARQAGSDRTGSRPSIRQRRALRTPRGTRAIRRRRRRIRGSAPSPRHGDRCCDARARLGSDRPTRR